MSWRNVLAKYLRNGGSGICLEFGIFTGKSVHDIANAYAFAGAKLQRVVGFDSFEGLPDERAEDLGQECWKKGAFSGADHFQTKSINETINKSADFIRGGLMSYTSLDLVPGFYCDSLTDDLPVKMNLQSVDYIDIDVDLYSSAKDCLDWVFRTGLVKPGTLIGYDDYMGCENWEGGMAGEARAHKEMCDKYNIKCKLLELFGSFPHGIALYIVESVG